MPLNDAPRDYSLTPIRASDSGDHSSLPPRFPGNGSPVAPGSTPRYAATSSRGPSPILPPIRDLHSLPDRSLTSGSPFSDGRPASRPDPFLPDYRSAPMDARGPWDRRNGDSASYMGTSGPAAMMHSHPAPYGYPMAYPSDSEQHSPQLVSHAQSNFGIMGDQTDSRNRRRRGNLPKPVTDILRAWFHEHLDHPYPSEEDKQMFMTRTGLSISQVSSICLHYPLLLWLTTSRSATGLSTPEDDSFPLFAIRCATVAATWTRNDSPHLATWIRLRLNRCHLLTGELQPPNSIIPSI